MNNLTISIQTDDGKKIIMKKIRGLVVVHHSRFNERNKFVPVHNIYRYVLSQAEMNFVTEMKRLLETHE